MEIDLSNPEKALEQAIEVLNETNTRLAALVLINRYLVVGLSQATGTDLVELRAAMKSAGHLDLRASSDAEAAARIGRAIDLFLSAPEWSAEIVPFPRRPEN